MKNFERLAILMLCCSVSTFSVAAQEGYVERMAQEHEGDSPIPSPAAQDAKKKPRTEKEVAYAKIGGVAVKGFLALPESLDPGAPAVVVIHEWWGLNDNVRAMARLLAAEGYAALAVDLYGGEVATTPDGARTLMSRATGDSAKAEDNLRQAVAYLRDRLGAPKVGVIGWCFGGGWSLQTAILAPASVQAAVIYYGRPETDRQRLGKIQAPILGHFGALDQGIPVASARQLEADLKALGKSAEIHVYEGADHAFGNPSGTRYNKQAADQAWARTLEFFRHNLRP
jgi:carboxymethylenebutenolidase